MAGNQVVMSVLERKQTIESALRGFATQPLYQAGMGLLDSLGYHSDRALRVSGLKAFRDTLDQQGRLRDDAAKTSEWVGVEFLRQITSEDVSSSAQGMIPFQKQFTPTEMQSYVFVAIELKRDSYTRTELSQITRAVNRVFDMPAMLLFKHGAGLTLAVISRRLNKRDDTRDVLEKVTLVKDITCVDPLRAHIEILHDLSLEALYEEFYFHNFAGLHQAWEKRLASYALDKRFYREVANWYFWALNAPGVVLPRSIQAIRNAEEREKQRSIFFIRLLTRLIFCWFLQEKGFLPRDLFRRRVAEELLKDTSPTAGTYYKAFLQNLFFATLNQERERRGWRKKYQGSRDGNRGVTSLWRYQELLTSPDQLEALLRDRIPFVNGGLFDCLDDPLKTPNVRLDDFLEERDNRLCLPNNLFFGEDRDVDLSAVYEDARRKKEKVSGLIEILSRYKFTVEENTPLEEEIALDPELLGKVFENLLASYNEDTRTTARKALGGFYTPREIVSYMVDEALLSYLTTRVPSVPEATIRALFAADAKAPPDLSPSQKASLVKAIGSVKILDPACGSGAFPMGALHRLVDLLQKLDPNNESWKRDRLAEAEKYNELLRQANAPQAELAEVEARIEDILHSFDTRFHALDFARKLYLIENCIYGVDIQPIACQIAKLRFFIAMANRELLETREHGKFRESGWWQLYPKNLDLWEQPKVMLPYMITQLAAFYDEEDAYFVNVTTGGFGLTARRAGWNLRLLTGLLNSNLLDWFLKRVSTTFHGGYFAANKQFLVQLPVASPNAEEGVSVGNFVDYLLWLNQRFQVHSEEKTSRDTLMLGYWEQALNGLVYELYFPEELHARGLRLFDLVQQVGLPALDTIPEAQRLSRLRKEFERVYDLQHPLRGALHDLQTVEEVRIIEGKA